MSGQQAYALEITDVCKNFSGIQASKDINIRVKEGEIYGIIGPNGAGKTTLFNLITGVYAPTSGSIRFLGTEIAGKPTHEISQMGIARTFQNIRLFGDLTVYQNVLTAYQYNLTYSFLDGILRTKKFRQQEKKAEEVCLDVLRRIGLYDLRDQHASKLPYGQQRRLEIVRAIVTGAKLLLLDEPAAGMNEEESLELSQIIKDIRKDYHVTIVIIDHHMDVIMDVCEQITVINFGEMLTTGTAEEIQSNQAVIDAYLGVNDDAED